MDFSKLRDMDYLLTTSLSAISCIIRKRTSGKWLDTKIATHVGLLINIRDWWYVAEMLAGKGLLISNVSKYLTHKYFASRIVTIRRNPAYDNEELRRQQKHDILYDRIEMIPYDLSGILEYLIPAIKERPDMEYCSEYVNRYALKAGNPIKRREPCSPYDIQVSDKLIDVEEWR